jgi:DNA-binding NtrC family response regulator
MSANILIVDDEKQLVYYLKQTLHLELDDVRVDTAYSGEEALSQLAGASYDLILADLRMPGFDGLELIKGVRYLDPDVPIVLMTGFGSRALQHQAKQMGVNHYVDKPFDIQEIMTVVNDLLESRHDAPA